jgi:hypothetical protein
MGNFLGSRGLWHKPITASAFVGRAIASGWPGPPAFSPLAAHKPIAVCRVQGGRWCGFGRRAPRWRPASFSEAGTAARLDSGSVLIVADIRAGKEAVGGAYSGDGKDDRLSPRHHHYCARSRLLADASEKKLR